MSAIDPNTPAAAAPEAAPAAPASPPAEPPKPWELAAQHASEEHTGKDPRPYTGPGAVTHTMPILSYGSAGEPVVELVGLLAKLGYRQNSIIKGRNPAYVLDETVMSDVRRFCAERHVSNDIREFEGQSVPAQDLVGNHVGPYIWQALIDACAELDRQ